MVGVFKICSALNNYDNLPKEGEFFKSSVRRRCRQFVQYFLDHTAEITKEIYEENTSLWNEIVYEKLDDIATDVESDEQDQLLVMLGKLKAAIPDWKAVEESRVLGSIGGQIYVRLKSIFYHGNSKEVGGDLDGIVELVNKKVKW